MEQKMKHLEFIQNVITRMNSNSFLIKGWAITLVSALFALAANGSNIHYVLISYIVIPVFWVLDGFYISIERQYRDLYNNVAQKTEEEIAKLEERNTVIDEELTKEEIYSNSIECQKLSTERAENEEKLEVLYERWEELAEEV